MIPNAACWGNSLGTRSATLYVILDNVADNVAIHHSQAT
jgi:hypothetical protein